MTEKTFIEWDILKMGTSSISFSLGGGAKGTPAAKVGFGIKAPKKVTPISAVFGADDSDTEEQEVVDHSAKRQRLESSGSHLAGLADALSVYGMLNVHHRGVVSPP